MSTKQELLTPAGRLVMGSLYKPNDKDAEGKPLVVKSGPNAGQPRVDYYFALAIPKAGEQHWAHTAWGQMLYKVGATAFPQAHQAPTFAWKVKDGDSTIPNRKGKRPCDQEGFPGHWVLSFSSGYPPKVFRESGTLPMPEVDAVNLGDWVQVYGSVDGNGSQSQPGIFLNHSMVNLVGYGQRIVVGPDAASVGFGKGVALPPGVSATPIASALTPAAAAAVAGVPAQPGAMFPGIPGAVPPAMPAPVMPPVGVPPVMQPPAAVSPVAVQPHPQFLQPPAAPAVPAMPPAAPVRQMTAKANGMTYEQFIGAGWNDQQLVQQGYMLA